MKIIDMLIDGVTIAAKALAAIMLAVMLLVVIAEVGSRYFFSISFPWANELIRFMMVWVAFIGGAVTFKDGGLVFFDMILNKLPPKTKTLFQLTINTVILVFCAYMFYMSWRTTFSRSIATQTAIGLQISMSIPYFGITLGLALFNIYCLYNYKKLITTVLGKGE